MVWKVATVIRVAIVVLLAFEMSLFSFWFGPELKINTFATQTMHIGEMLVVGIVILTECALPQDRRMFDDVAAIRHHVMLISVREAQMGVPYFIYPLRRRKQF